MELLGDSSPWFSLVSAYLLIDFVLDTFPRILVWQTALENTASLSGTEGRFVGYS